MPRALITGITGFVGSHLADFLLSHTDWDVWGMMRWDDNLANIQHLIPEINKDDHIHLLNGDLTMTTPAASTWEIDLFGSLVQTAGKTATYKAALCIALTSPSWVSTPNHQRLIIPS